MASRAFGDQGPNRPHLVTDGKRGVAGEVGDLRSDVELAFARSDQRTDFPLLSRVVGGRSIDPAGLPATKNIVGTDLLQGQTKASLTFGASTAQLDFEANRPGTPGNAISVAIVDSTGGGLAVTESGGAIEIDLGGATSDADAIKTAMDAVAAVARLIQVTSGGAGVPAVTALALLTGGLGEGVVIYVNGEAQQIRGAMTDVLIPLEITVLTSAADEDTVSLQLKSDDVYSEPMSVGVGDLYADVVLINTAIDELKARTGYPLISRVVLGEAISLAAMPVAKNIVGTDFLQGRARATLTIGTGTAQLDFDANRPGTPGNAITVEIVDTSGGGLAVTEAAGVIEIDLGGATSDADTIKTALDAVTGVARLVQVTSGGAGVPVVTAVANLAGGTGSGLFVYLNGIDQAVEGAVTDTLIPMVVSDLTGAIHGDAAVLQVQSDVSFSDAATLGVITERPQLTRITGGTTTVSISGMPIDKPLVGTALLAGRAQATLTFGTGTSQLDFDANRPGADGNDITIEIVDSTGGGLAITQSGGAIEIDLGGATSDADAIKTAWDLVLDVLDLATCTSGGAGVPVVTAVDNLAGGTGLGFSVMVNGIEQRLTAPVTDVLVPLSIYSLTGAANLDEAQVLVTTDGKELRPMQLSIVT